LVEVGVAGNWMVEVEVVAALLQELVVSFLVVQLFVFSTLSLC